jgi:hypothetical protein
MPLKRPLVGIEHTQAMLLHSPRPEQMLHSDRLGWSCEGIHEQSDQSHTHSLELTLTKLDNPSIVSLSGRGWS